MSNPLLALLNSAAATATTTPVSSSPAPATEKSASDAPLPPTSNGPAAKASAQQPSPAAPSNTSSAAASSLSILDLLYSASNRITSPSAPPASQPPPSHEVPPSPPPPPAQQQQLSPPPKVAPSPSAANLLALLSGPLSTASPPADKVPSPFEQPRAAGEMASVTVDMALQSGGQDTGTAVVDARSVDNVTPDVVAMPPPAKDTPSGQLGEESVISLITPPGTPGAAKSAQLPVLAHQDPDNAGPALADPHLHATHHLAASFSGDDDEPSDQDAVTDEESHLHTLDLTTPRPGRLPFYPAKLEFREVARLQPKPLAHLRTSTSHGYTASRIAHLGSQIVCYAMSKGTIRVIDTLTGARTLLVTPDRADVKHIVAYNGSDAGTDREGWLLAALTDVKNTEHGNAVVYWIVPRIPGEEWPANIRATEALSSNEGTDPFIGLQWHPTESRMLLVAAKDRVLLLELASPTEDILFSDPQIHAFSASADGSVIASLTQSTDGIRVRLRDLHRVVSSWDAALNIPPPSQLPSAARVSSFQLIASSGGAFGMLIGFDRDTLLGLYDVKLRAWTAVWDFHLPAHVGQHFNLVRFDAGTRTLLVFNSLRSSMFCTRFNLGPETGMRSMLDVAKSIVSGAHASETLAIATAPGFVEFVLAHPAMSACATRTRPGDQEGDGFKVFVSHAAGIYIVLVPDEGFQAIKTAPLKPLTTVASSVSHSVAPAVAERLAADHEAEGDGAQSPDSSDDFRLSVNRSGPRTTQSHLKKAFPSQNMPSSGQQSSAESAPSSLPTSSVPGTPSSRKAKQKQKANLAKQKRGVVTSSASAVALNGIVDRGVSPSAMTRSSQSNGEPTTHDQMHDVQGWVREALEAALLANKVKIASDTPAQSNGNNSAEMEATASRVTQKVVEILADRLPVELDRVFRHPRVYSTLLEGLGESLSRTVLPEAALELSRQLLSLHLDSVKKVITSSSSQLRQGVHDEISRINVALQQSVGAEKKRVGEMRDMTLALAGLTEQVQRLADVNTTLVQELAEVKMANARLEGALQSGSGPSRLALAPEVPAPMPQAHPLKQESRSPSLPALPDLLSSKEELEDHLLSALSSHSTGALRQALQSVYDTGVQRWPREPWSSVHATFTELSQPVLLVTLHRLAPALLAEALQGPERTTAPTPGVSGESDALPLGLAIPFLELCARSLRPRDPTIAAAYADNAAKIREHIVRAQTEVGRRWNVIDNGGAWRAHWWSEERCREGVLAYLP